MTRSKIKMEKPEVNQKENPGEHLISREKAKAALRARRRLLAQKNHENLTKKDRLADVPDITPERLVYALKAIKGALDRLKSKTFQALFKKGGLTKEGITLESADYYLAIAIKESRLNPLDCEAKLGVPLDARGLFKIKDEELNNVNEIFQFNKYKKTITAGDIFYLPTPTKNKKEAAQQAKNLDIAMQNNALVGILNWHLCKDVRREQNKLQIRKEDQDRAAALIHEFGIDDFDNLWKSLNSKNFTDFAGKISAQLAQKFPNNFVLPKGGRDVFEDDIYKVNYTSYIYTRQQAIWDKIKIGTRAYNVSRLIKALRDSEIIQSLAHSEPTINPEIIRADYQLQNIAEKLLIRCSYGFVNDYCRNINIPDKRKIKLLTEIIISYNLEKKNPSFRESDSDEGEGLQQLKNGAKVFLPPKEVLEKAFSKAFSDVKIEGERLAPGKVPLYGGLDAAKLEKFGNEFFIAPKVPPKIVIPKFRGEYLDPDVESGHGHMPKDATQGIVLHTTEGTVYPWLYEDQNIHYILKRNGTLELIHSPDFAVSHCGSMAQKPKKRALWNGENSPTYHFVGIEIENQSMDWLIRKGRIAITVEKNAKITTGPRYFTSTPPTKAAIDSAFKQAKEERGFTEDQYAALRAWIPYIGAQKGLRKREVITHSMVATQGTARGRKSDPPVLDWARLNLPNNYFRVDPEVATGRLKGNVSESERIRTTDGISFRKSKGRYEVFPTANGTYAYCFSAGARFGGDKDMTAGIKAAEKIWKDKQKHKKK